MDQHPERFEEHPGHETTDAEVKPILQFLFGLALLLILAMVSMNWLFSILESRYRSQAEDLPPLLDTQQIPAGPRLQANPSEDLLRMRQWETDRLSSYEWIDADKGTMRIPVERAIEILAETGLPARASDEGDPDNER